jgi:hypothetical protein
MDEKRIAEIREHCEKVINAFQQILEQLEQAQKEIEMLKERHNQAAINWQQENEECRKLQSEIERLREAPRWIPVEEKLPDFNDKSYHPIAHNCFVRDMHNNYASAIFYQPVTDKCDPWITSDEDIDTILITHWMPLPAPPKENEQ